MEKIVSVVTGATSGIGKAIAYKILAESVNDDDILIVNYGHNEENAKLFMEGIEEEQRKKVVLLKADLSSYEGMLEFVKRILEVSDKIDRLVLNAAIGTYEKFDNYTIELWNKVMTTNLTIPVFLVKELKPHINNGGKILFLGSTMGHLPHSSSIVYGVSKAGVQFFAQTIMKEFDGTGISINTITPGFIETRWQKDRSQESYDRINKKIALHRFGEPEEVANLCYAVLTNDYINGNVIDIHGGYNYF